MVINLNNVQVQNNVRYLFAYNKLPDQPGMLSLNYGPEDSWLVKEVSVHSCKQSAIFPTSWSCTKPFLTRKLVFEMKETFGAREKICFVS
jgi:hypothetical protein